MGTFNQSTFNQPVTTSTVASVATFDEEYIRNYILDVGDCAAESSYIKINDSFTVAAGQLEFVLSQQPTNDFPVFLTVNNKNVEFTVEYSINGKVVDFADSILKVGDVVGATYWVAS